MMVFEVPQIDIESGQISRLTSGISRTDHGPFGRQTKSRATFILIALIQEDVPRLAGHVV